MMKQIKTIILSSLLFSLSTTIFSQELKKSIDSISIEKSNFTSSKAVIIEIEKSKNTNLLKANSTATKKDNLIINDSINPSKNIKSNKSLLRKQITNSNDILSRIILLNKENDNSAIISDSLKTVKITQKNK